MLQMFKYGRFFRKNIQLCFKKMWGGEDLPVQDVALQEIQSPCVPRDSHETIWAQDVLIIKFYPKDIALCRIPAKLFSPYYL